MVNKSALTRKIEVRLSWMRDHFQDLRWHAERYGSTVDGHAASSPDLEALRYEWQDVLDRLEGLHEWFLDGKLSPEQAAQHRQNLALLAAQLPAIRQLGLRMPSCTLVPSPEETATPGS